MPIYTIDTEFTEKQELVVASITNEKMKTITFTNKQEIQDYIKKIAYANAKRNINTYIYAHFHKIDLPIYWDLNEVVINKEVPLIAHHIIKLLEKKRPSKIYFLDTMALFRGSVEDIMFLLDKGKKNIEFTENDKKELIKLRKYLKQKPFKFSKTKNIILEKWIKYNKQDTKVLMEFLLLIKQKCKENNINVKKLFSAGQIAINNILNILAEQPEKYEIFENLYKRVFYQQTKEINEKIHKAYRGPRNQVWNIGNFNQVYYMDLNSAYGWAFQNIEIPLLKKIEYRFFNKYVPFDDFAKKVYLERDIHQIGITKAIMYKKTPLNVGYLSIRWENHSIFPNNPNSILIGTWTNYEIKKALKEGYEIIHIFECICYPEKIENPLKPLIDNWYNQRLKSKIDKFFFKGLITNGIGKFGEIRKDREILIDDASLIEEYTKKGFKVINNQDTNNFVYEKIYKEVTPKYYCPIIPAYITAFTRNQLYSVLKKIPVKHLIQTNTDSIMFLENKYIKHFNQSNKLGYWKLEKNGVPAKIFAKNSYTLDSEIRISGINKKQSQKQAHLIQADQNIKFTKFKSLFENNKAEEQVRDFKKSMIKEKEFQKNIKKNIIFIDEKEKDEKIINWLLENNELIENLINKK